MLTETWLTAWATAGARVRSPSPSAIVVAKPILRVILPSLVEMPSRRLSQVASPTVKRPRWRRQPVGPPRMHAAELAPFHASGASRPKRRFAREPTLAKHRRAGIHGDAAEDHQCDPEPRSILRRTG